MDPAVAGEQRRLLEAACRWSRLGGATSLEPPTTCARRAARARWRRGSLCRYLSFADGRERRPDSPHSAFLSDRDLRAALGTTDAGRVGAERGTKELGSRSYPLVAPVILAGQERTREAALNERPILLNPKPDRARELRPQRPSGKLVRARLEAFTLPYWAWALGQRNWLELLETTRDQTRQWAETIGFEQTPRVLSNLAIARLGWGMFLASAEHLGLEVAPLHGGDLGAAFLIAALEVMPTGGARDNLDELMLLVQAMVANKQLEHGAHYATTQAGVALLLRDVLPEARRYARETDHRPPKRSSPALQGRLRLASRAGLNEPGL